MLIRQLVQTSWRKSADESSCSQSCYGEVQLEERDGRWGWWKERWCRKAQSWFPPSCLHTCSLNWKELVLQLLVSQLSMVRSVKVTLPSASIRIIVLVLNGQGYKKTHIELLTDNDEVWWKSNNTVGGRGNTEDNYDQVTFFHLRYFVNTRIKNEVAVADSALLKDTLMAVAKADPLTFWL